MNYLFLVFTFLMVMVSAQPPTKQDTLKGSNTVYRNFWDVKKYNISVEPDYQTKSLKGSSKIIFQILTDIENPTFQIDLQQPMKYKLSCRSSEFSSKREGDFIFITAKKKYKKGDKDSFLIEFSGNPIIAQRAPWDGGWVFTNDDQGNPWMSVAQEGTGASVWLPSKDIWSDEPEEGMEMNIITPKTLVGVGNGRLISKKSLKNKDVYTWRVVNPINLYSIVPNVGKYVNFKEEYEGEKGKLDLDYWVLHYNLEKAKKQFAQVKPMMAAFEHWFGPYPFYEDSYKIVESPYLGMEHQSSVAYGNHFENGYLGRDLSGTGVGLNWDFIIIHESAHEWFANNITAKDQADMWIHESFTNYAETLFTEQYMDKKSAERYVKGIRKNITNDRPIIGQYGIRKTGSSDMYYKGANMIHTLRQVIHDDEKFREILRGLNRDFYHQTVTTRQVEDYISDKAGLDLSGIFDQYLRTTLIPSLEYRQVNDTLSVRYRDTVPHFKMPLRLLDGQVISPTAAWQTVKLKSVLPVQFDDNYYVKYVESDH